MGTTNVKQTPIPVVPRTMKIVNPDGTPTRSGQLLLQQLQASSTIFGTHDTRPAPGDAPAGALYFESDRGVLYSNENGNWQYVAGTMYGTLNPDQRPTDLGQYDGGFEFVANDADPAIRGRSFIWDGTEWVETTQVLYGLHADRPAVADAPARCLYVETDRSSVIYQNQGTAWQYVAGIMYGTLSPDQRPTDLDSNSAGFTFKTNVDPSRSFTWNGGQWVETTPIRYGTHAQRLASDVTVMVSGMFWTETDRGNVIYELQGGVWLFITGTMWSTLVPDNRPTDLGVNDDGFTYLATVSPLREFIWASPSWVETTAPSGMVNLTHPNVVTKVGATVGSIVESGGISDLTPTGPVTITGPDNGPGTGGGTGQFAGGDKNHQTRVGYNKTSNYGWIQPSDGVGFTNLVLNGGGGNVGFGAANPTHQVELSLDSAAKPATSSWTVFSDIRLKQNLLPVKDDSLAILGKLNWVRYEYNGLAAMPRGLKGIGLIAQALQDELPEAVRSAKAKLKETDADEVDVLSIDYHHILVHSARAIQQLGAELEALRVLIGKP
jgi:hypothetical protein